MSKRAVESLHKTGPGVAYTKSPVAYLFERVSARSKPQHHGKPVVDVIDKNLW